MESKIKLVKQCHACHKDITVEVFQKDLDRYNDATNREHIQNIFPYLEASERELFLSGLCGSCWDELFMDLEDE